MTEEKEMVLTEFASQFHRLLSNKITVFTFQDQLSKSNRDLNTNYYLSLHKNLVQKEPGVIRKILKSSLDGFKPNFFFLSSTLLFCSGRHKLSKVVSLLHSDNRSMQLLPMEKV